MKLLEFVQKFKLLTVIIILFNIIFATFLLLSITRPIEWLRFSQKIIGIDSKSSSQENISSLNYDNKYFEGKIVEIKDELVKIETADSYYTIKINKDIPIQSLDDNQSIKISDLTKGWQIGASIDGSKFTSSEPFTVEYIMVLEETNVQK